MAVQYVVEGEESKQVPVKLSKTSIGVQLYVCGVGVAYLDSEGILQVDTGLSDTLLSQLEKAGIQVDPRRRCIKVVV